MGITTRRLASRLVGDRYAITAALHSPRGRAIGQAGAVTKGTQRIAAIGAIVATPVATWWLIGDQSATLRGRRELDYIARPPDVPGWIVTIGGAAALVVVVACVVGLIRGQRTGQLDRRWLSAVAALMGAGALAAVIGRTVTAGVVGANIGAGLALFFVAPIIVVLIAFAALRAVAIRRTLADT